MCVEKAERIVKLTPRAKFPLHEFYTRHVHLGPYPVTSNVNPTSPPRIPHEIGKLQTV